jgi:hypothetical protein
MHAVPTSSRVLSRALLALCLLGSSSLLGSLATAADSAAPTVKIAVFDFELEDLSAASVLLGQSTSGSDSLHKVGEAARKELTKSGRYLVIDPSRDAAEFSKDKALKDCGGCEAAVASRLGADQSLIGLVRRVSQTDYYVIVQVRDVHSGKVLAQEAANFAGGEEGWASGVRMLIDHQVLPVTAALPPAQAACKMADVNPVSGQAECVDPQGAPVAPPPPRDDKS